MTKRQKIAFGIAMLSTLFLMFGPDPVGGWTLIATAVLYIPSMAYIIFSKFFTMEAAIKVERDSNLPEGKSGP